MAIGKLKKKKKPKQILLSALECIPIILMLLDNESVIFNYADDSPGMLKQAENWMEFGECYQQVSEERVTCVALSELQ